jgi:diguanylate cyclase (GGDEF)-like protein/PAS domain S-box-containing protein
MMVTHGAPARWAGFIDAMLDAVWLVDLNTLTIAAANAEAGRLFGMPAAGLLGRPVLELVATPQDEALWQELQMQPGAYGPEASVAVDTWVLAVDGSRHPVTSRVTVLPEGAARGMALVALRPRSTELALRDELDRRVGELEATLESTADGILVTDLAGAVQRFNRRFAQLWNVPDVLTGERNDAALKSWMRNRVRDAGAWQRLQERWTPGMAAVSTDADLLTLQDGCALECRSLPLVSAGITLGCVTSFRDLSERQRSQRQIERLMTTDTLTGLPNRHAFTQRMAEVLTLRAAQQRRLAEGRDSAAQPRRPRTGGDERGSALMLIDLDRFRTINDTLGSPAGDAVLVESARRLEGAIGRADQLARVGGDEFAIRLDTVDARAAEVVAKRLLGVLGEPYSHAGTRFTLTASIGISLIDDTTSSVDEAMQEADAAMRRAKEAGRATFRFHQARHNIDLRERLRIDQAMREGLPAGDFRLLVQPQIDLRTGRLLGGEALLRWRDPVLGDMSPARFIPLAEDNGFIVDLGQWVLDQASHLAAGWMRDGQPLPISVNVSALQFRQPDFVDRVALALDRAALPARLMELELTESILLDDAADAQRRLADLCALGVRLALDDFGTGYSSLAYLRDLPLHRLKLDRTFIAPLPTATRQAAIVHAVVQMAHALKLDVVAEGVETGAQAEFLRATGCGVAQGYLFGRPMEPARVAERIAQQAAAGRRPDDARDDPSPPSRPAPLGGPSEPRRTRRGPTGLTLVKA